MNVVDSSAWLSYFADDDNAEFFSEPIENIPELLVPSIVFTEVFRNVLRQRGEDSALIITAHINQGKIISLDSELAMDAAKFAVRHKLPLADSIIFATAQKYSALLWTQDAYFESLENVRYISSKSQ